MKSLVKHYKSTAGQECPTAYIKTSGKNIASLPKNKQLEMHLIICIVSYLI